MFRPMRWSIVFVVVATAGCDDLFNLEHVTYAPGDATRDAGPDAPPDAPLACPADYTTINGDAHYRLVATAVSFVEAATDCADDETAGPAITMHTHLAVLSSTAETAYLYGLGSSRWIGLTDLTANGIWKWVTDEAALDPSAADTSLWATGEPNNPSTELCGHFDSFHTNRVNNVICGETHAYACECDAFPNISSRYQ